MKFKAIVHEEETGGYWAEVPALPGCATQGETIEELVDNLREAIAGWLDIPVSELDLEPGDQVLEIAV